MAYQRHIEDNITFCSMWSVEICIHFKVEYSCAVVIWDSLGTLAGFCAGRFLRDSCKTPGV
jgi:hypothetical protein